MPTPQPALLSSEAVQQLLAAVQQRFYPALAPGEHAAGPAANFHRDRRLLLYALSWPATWLEHRGLTCAPARYHALLAERLATIAAHGDPQRYGAYFPAYLLKCLQDWFQHHGDQLYDELKHVRNALDQVLASARFAETVRFAADYTELLASAHRIIHAQRSKPHQPDQRQLPLF